MQDPNPDNPHDDAPSQAVLAQWPKELAELKQQHIKFRGWSPSQVQGKIKSCWAVLCDGVPQISFEKNPPVAPISTVFLAFPPVLEI